MSAILYLLLGCIPPLAAGPFAGIAFVEIIKRRKPWYLLPFWVVLALLNLLIMLWVASSAGAWLPISSLSAFFITPVASILTVFVMRKAWRRLESANGVSAADKHWFTLGCVLIPALQIGMFVALLIYSPWLCKVGLVVCKDL
jgi:uncharacterized membrane protein